MMWSECKELWTEGPREYIQQLWNVLDFGMLSIFIAAFTARFFAFLQATRAQQYVNEKIHATDLSLVTLPPEVKYFTYGERRASVSILFLMSGCRMNTPMIQLRQVDIFHTSTNTTTHSKYLTTCPARHVNGDVIMLGVIDDYT